MRGAHVTKAFEWWFDNSPMFATYLGTFDEVIERIQRELTLPLKSDRNRVVLLIALSFVPEWRLPNAATRSLRLSDLQSLDEAHVNLLHQAVAISAGCPHVAGL
jgi:hypothetical protein